MLLNRNMKAVIAFCLFQILIATVSSLDQECYWRDYRGTLPEDALIVDTDSNQRRMAIGTVFIDDGGLLIGTLYEDNQNIIVTGWPEPKIHLRNTRIKVLCTQSPDNYEWRAITSSQLADLAYIAVKGGFEGEKETPLYIGKTNYGNETKVGKVVGDSTDKNFGLFFFYNDSEEARTDSYSLLIRKENSLTQNSSSNITNVNVNNL